MGQRAEPYPFSDADIEALLHATSTIRTPLKAATYETLLGLLVVTGMRVGEAIRLDRADVDWDNATLTVVNTKFGKSRRLPLHPTTMAALDRYRSRRDRCCPHPATQAMFVSTTGTRLLYANVHQTWLNLIGIVGLEPLTPRCRPCIHDLRHRFAVPTLIGWYRDGGTVEAQLPALSAYLGHRSPGDTYWYLHAAPELLTLAAHRLRSVGGE